MIPKKPVRDLIAELDQADETEALEAKRAQEAGASLYETICAMSNEPGMGGGTVLLGVAKDDATLFPMFRVEGVANPDKTAAEIASTCATIFNLPVRPDITRHLVKGKVVIRVDVSELSQAQKPLYFVRKGLPNGAFRRIGSTDQRCNSDDIHSFYQNRNKDTIDSIFVEGSEYADLDQESIDTYRSARRTLNPLAEELNWSNEELLVSLNCLIKVDGVYQVTRAGLICFGKPQALRRLDPSNRVDYIRVPGKAWVRDPDNFLEAVEIRGPALRTVGRVMSAVLDDLPRALRINDGNPQRTELPLIPERVIREAVVNAITHRNYAVHEPIQILRYSNRIEIRNPGYSLKSEERYDDPGSQLRNPYIAEVMHETRFAETKGSGIRVMRQKMRESGLSEPTFISSRENDKFTIILLLHHFLSEDDWLWLALFKEFELTNEQLRALVYVREMGAIDNTCYRNLNQVDVLEASRSLRRMGKLELVTSRGSGSATRYEPGPQFLAIDRRAPTAKRSSTIEGNGHTIHGTPSTIHGSSARALPTAIAAQIGRLGKRVPPSMMRHLIREICTWKPCSAEEISNWLGKTRLYMTDTYLARMVRDGTLFYTIPEMIKHPRQQYTTKPPSKGVLDDPNI